MVDKHAVAVDHEHGEQKHEPHQAREEQEEKIPAREGSVALRSKRCELRLYAMQDGGYVAQATLALRGASKAPVRGGQVRRELGGGFEVLPRLLELTALEQAKALIHERGPDIVQVEGVSLDAKTLDLLQQAIRGLVAPSRYSFEIPPPIVIERGVKRDRFCLADFLRFNRFDRAKQQYQRGE